MDATSTTSSAASSVDGRSVGGNGTDFLTLGMFATSGAQVTPAHSNDLLVGDSGAFSLGGNVNTNAFGAESSGGTSFDLSDFPSLGGGGGSSTGGVVMANASTGANGLAHVLRQQQQQQLLAHQHMMPGAGPKNSNLYRNTSIIGANGNFNMASEDFPALSTGASSSTANGPTSGSALTGSSLLSGNVSSISRASSATSGGGLYASEIDSGLQLPVDGATALLGGTTGLGGLGGLRGLSQQPAVSRTGSSAGAIGTPSVAAAGGALSGDYGLLGLLGVIRMTDADRNALAVGSDLTLLGLNLGSTEQIYSTFSGPFSDTATTKEPHFQLPMCYYMQPPALKTGHLSKFLLETLFYIFYALPRDVLQAYAAQELYQREWRYHSELKLWFKRAGPADGITNTASGSLQYLYFDINSWERRLFNSSMNQNITNGFLSEEEVRVKFPNS